MSPDDCYDTIKKNLDNFLPKDMTPDKLFLRIADNLMFDSVD